MKYESEWTTVTDRTKWIEGKKQELSTEDIDGQEKDRVGSGAWSVLYLPTNARSWHDLKQIWLNVVWKSVWGLR